MEKYTPLDFLQFFAETFKGTEYEAFVNIVLLGLFGISILASIRLILIGSGLNKTFLTVSKSIGVGLEEVRKNMVPAPGAKKVFDKIGPYFDLLAYSYFLICNIGIVIVFSLLLYLASDIIWKFFILCVALIIVFSVSAVICFAKITWAYHHIKYGSAT